MKNPQSAKAAQDMGYESMVRLAASLEHLEVEDKVLLASWFLSKVINFNQFEQAHWWALGRLASRTPFMAANTPSFLASKWNSGYLNYLNKTGRKNQ